MGVLYIFNDFKKIGVIEGVLFILFIYYITLMVTYYLNTKE